MDNWDIKIFVAYNATVSEDGDTAKNLWLVKGKDGKSEFDLLRDQSAEGWELISTTPINRDGNTHQVLFTFKQPKKMVKKWEYITIRQTLGFGGLNSGVYYILPNGEEKKWSGGDHDGKNIHKLFNSFGQQGFELVEAVTSDTNVSIYQRVWVMKRQTPER